MTRRGAVGRNHARRPSPPPPPAPHLLGVVVPPALVANEVHADVKDARDQRRPEQRQGEDDDGAQEVSRRPPLPGVVRDLAPGNDRPRDGAVEVGPVPHVQKALLRLHTVPLGVNEAVKCARRK